MRWISIITVFFLLVCPTIYAEDLISLDDKRTIMWELEVKHDSPQGLPMEGDLVNFTFYMKPTQDINKTENGYGMIYFLISPDDFVSKGVTFLPGKSYSRQVTYISQHTEILDVPGFWRIRYTLASSSDLDKIGLIWGEGYTPNYFKTKKIHVLSLSEAKNLEYAEKSHFVNIIALFLSLVGVVLGGSITYFITHKTEIKREEKEKQDLIYAPLYYELEKINTEVSSFQRNFRNEEWDEIKKKSYLHKIKPQSLNEKLVQFYNTDSRNYFNSRNNTINSVTEFLRDEFGIGDELYGSELESIAKCMIQKDSIGTISSAEKAITSLRENGVIKYKNLEEVEKKIKKKVLSLDEVKYIKSEQEKIMREIKEIRNLLAKKLNLNA